MPAQPNQSQPYGAPTGQPMGAPGHQTGHPGAGMSHAGQPTPLPYQSAGASASMVMPKKKSKAGLVAVVLLLLAGAGGGVFFVLNQQDSKEAVADNGDSRDPKEPEVKSNVGSSWHQQESKRYTLQCKQ